MTKWILQICGLLLVAAGFYVLIGAPTYPRDRSVLKFGEFEATVRERQPVPPWSGGLSIGLGAALVAFGFSKGR
ncbi:MAG: hypothetical protein KGL34_09015 [Gammaproteobacteria bacterium]|nr:hypothetical protein [Gammaproteobacteria bacterium]